MKKILITLLLMLLGLVGCGEVVVEEVDTSDWETYEIIKEDVRVKFEAPFGSYSGDQDGKHFISNFDNSTITVALHTKNEAEKRWSKNRLDNYPFGIENAPMYFHSLDVLCDPDNEDSELLKNAEEDLEEFIDSQKFTLKSEEEYLSEINLCYQPERDYSTENLNIDGWIFVQPYDGYILTVWTHASSLDIPSLKNSLEIARVIAQNIEFAKID